MSFWPKSEYRIKEAFAGAAYCAGAVFTAWYSGPVIAATAFLLSLSLALRHCRQFNFPLPEKTKERLHNSFMKFCKFSPAPPESDFQKIADSLAERRNQVRSKIAYHEK